MPIGVITNVLAVIVGGIIGTLVGPGLSERFKEGLNTIFGVCAMTMGISSIVLMENMPAVIFLALFYLAGAIYPFCSPSMINDFKACGGVLLLATGFRMIRVKEFSIADMIPAMILVMPLSHIWTVYILPLVAG